MFLLGVGIPGPRSLLERLDTYTRWGGTPRVGIVGVGRCMYQRGRVYRWWIYLGTVIKIIEILYKKLTVSLHNSAQLF